MNTKASEDELRRSPHFDNELVQAAKYAILNLDRSDKTYNELVSSVKLKASQMNKTFLDKSESIRIAALLAFNDIEGELQSFKILANSADKIEEYNTWKAWSGMTFTRKFIWLTRNLVHTSVVGLVRPSLSLFRQAVEFGINNTSPDDPLLGLYHLGYLYDNQIECEPPAENITEEDVTEPIVTGEVPANFEGGAQFLLGEPHEEPSDNVKINYKMVEYKPFQVACVEYPVGSVDFFRNLNFGSVYTIPENCFVVRSPLDQFFYDGIECKLDAGPVPKNCQIYRLRNPGPRNKTYVYKMVGPVCYNIMPGCHSNSASNEYISIVGRHMKSHSDEPDDLSTWASFTQAHVGKLVDIVKPYYNSKPIPVWLEAQEPAKRNAYTKHFNNNDSVHAMDTKKHDRLFFIKKEVLVPVVGKPLQEKRPRGIQGLNAANTNTVLGPFMRDISKAFSYAFCHAPSENGKTLWPRIGYTNGANIELIGTWYDDMLRDGYHFLENDFSEYDSTQGRGAHDMEMNFYKAFNPSTPVLYALQAQESTKGFSTYYKYNVKYTRKSGDQNTSLGNSIINAVVHMQAMVMAGIDDFYLICLGDDMLLAFKGDKNFALHCVQATCSKLGLVSKSCLPVYPSYCSSYFAPTTTGHILCPDVVKLVAKLGVTTSFIYPGKELHYIRENLLGQPLLQQVPVLRCFYSHYVGLGLDRLAVRKQWCAHERTTTAQMLDSTWLCGMYGISIFDLESLEVFLSTMLASGGDRACVWSHPVFTAMVARK